MRKADFERLLVFVSRHRWPMGAAALLGWALTGERPYSSTRWMPPEPPNPII